MLTNSLNKTIIISNIIKYLCVFKIGPVRPKRHDETYIYNTRTMCEFTDAYTHVFGMSIFL